MLIDLHAHTSGISKCCHIAAPEVLEVAKKAGIDGIALTNHYKKEYLADCDIKSFVEKYINEYLYTKRLAESIGLKCFFGIEVTMVNYPGADMLIYGIGVNFLRAYPKLFDYSQEELYKLVKKENGILIQAHPFRNGSTLLNVDYLDGIEVNCHPLYKKIYYKESLELARKKNLIITCGGDFYADTYRPKCGMLLPDYISDEGELKDYLIGTDKYNLCLDEPNGEVFDITVENYKIGEKTL